MTMTSVRTPDISAVRQSLPMKILLSFLFLLIVHISLAQTSPPRLIVRGDDMGYAHGGNEALIKCYKDGIETSIEVLVPSPWFPEAIQMLAENPTVDVGIHLTLSSEWDNLKWRPVSDCPSLRDADGYFYPMIYPNRNYPKRSVVENNWQLADVEKEFRAQIELALKKIPRISHISGHMGCTGMGDDVKALVKKLAQEYKIDIEPDTLGVTSIGYMGAHATSEEKIDSFLKMLEQSGSGQNVSVCRPPRSGYARASGHSPHWIRAGCHRPAGCNRLLDQCPREGPHQNQRHSVD